MKSEFYIEANGEVHRVAEAITCNFILVCEEVVLRGKSITLGNNLQGRRCCKCFGPSIPATRPDTVTPTARGTTHRGVVPAK